MRRIIPPIGVALAVCALGQVSGSAFAAETPIVESWSALQKRRSNVESNYQPIVRERLLLEGAVRRAEQEYGACNSMLADETPKQEIESSQGFWRALSRDARSLEELRGALELRNGELINIRRRIEAEKIKRGFAWYEREINDLIRRTDDEYLSPFETEVVAPTLSYLNGVKVYLGLVKTAARLCKAQRARTLQKTEASTGAFRILYNAFVTSVAEFQSMLVVLRERTQ